MNNTTESRVDDQIKKIEVGVAVTATLVILLGIVIVCIIKRAAIRRRLGRCGGKGYHASQQGHDNTDGDGFIDDSPFTITLEAGASEYTVDGNSSEFDDDPIYVADLRVSKFEDRTAMHIEDEPDYEDDDLGLGN